MLITKEVNMNITGSNKKYYNDRDYKSNVGDCIVVNVKDLPDNSKAIVKCICDYCNETIMEKNYQMYIKQNKKSIIKKDCCNKCRPQKSKESNLATYGVENTSSLTSVKEKRLETCVERYGVENPLQIQEVKNRVKSTNLERYGFTTSSQNPIIKEKSLNIILNSKYRNGTAPYSRQQEYICNVVGGLRNYPILDLGWLDIAFPNEKVYIEYDGSGHNLNVQFGILSDDEFYQKEKKRYYYLKNRDWKMVRIISTKDVIPTDIKIKEMVSFAKDYLNDNHTWIKFDIDNSKILCSSYEKDFDFGELRKIAKVDIANIS